MRWCRKQPFVKIAVVASRPWAGAKKTGNGTLAAKPCRGVLLWRLGTNRLQEIELRSEFERVIGHGTGFLEPVCSYCYDTVLRRINDAYHIRDFFVKVSPIYRQIGEA